MTYCQLSQSNQYWRINLRIASPFLHIKPFSFCTTAEGKEKDLPKVRNELKRRKGASQRDSTSKVLFKFEYEDDEGEVKTLLVREVRQWYHISDDVYHDHVGVVIGCS